MKRNFLLHDLITVHLALLHVEEHKERDRKRQRSEDTSAYVNGVLFGFDPDRPLEDQVEG